MLLRAQLQETDLLTTIKCVLFSLQILSEVILNPRNVQPDTVVNICSSSYFNKTWIFSKGFRKILIYIKFHENSSSGGWVVPCAETDGRTDRQTDMTKIRTTFRSLAKAANNRTGHLSTFCRQNAESFDVAVRGLYSLNFKQKAHSMYIPLDLTLKHWAFWS